MKHLVSYVNKANVRASNNSMRVCFIKSQLFMRYFWNPSWASSRTSRSLKIWSRDQLICRRGLRASTSWTHVSQPNSRTSIKRSRRRTRWSRTFDSRSPPNWESMSTSRIQGLIPSCSRRIRSRETKRSERRAPNASKPSPLRRANWPSPSPNCSRKWQNTHTWRKSTRESLKRS